MGNRIGCCFEVVYSTEYNTMTEDDEHIDRSCSSVTNGTYHSETNLLSRSAVDEMIFPQQFGKFYELGDLVGVGTTSRVYKVSYKISTKWTSTESQPLACKIIDKRGITHGVDEYDIDPLLEQLCREVEILKRIHHENIVSFYDYMETKDHLFIITERLDGGELFDHILNNGPMSEETARRILFGVFSAVAYLHERGVVHRDIKAENLIFFKNSYGEDALKLIDFGFSTILRNHLTGSFMGTGGYIAPEIRQNKNYSTSVDAWSLGVLVYCTLSAKLPFGVSMETLPGSIDDCRGLFSLAFPPKTWAHISEPCKDLISRLLELDPIQRFTPKKALSHPWFEPEQIRNKQLSALAGVSHSNSSDTLADFVPTDSLPVLHPLLRPTLSMSELECRSGEHSIKYSDGDHLTYTPVEYDMITGQTYTLDAHTPSVSNNNKERSQKCQSPGTPGRKSSLDSNTDSKDSKTTDTSHECTFSGTSWTAPVETRSHRAATDEEITGHRSALQWGETHSHAAGELFYTTFQHAAAIASPKRSVHS